MKNKAWILGISDNAVPINNHNITLRREQRNSRSQLNRERAFVARRDSFLRQYDLDDADGPSVINTLEETDLRNWCLTKSWSFCEKCGRLSSRKFLPSFRTTASSPLDKSCRCGNTIYSVPQVEDVPLLLTNLSANDIRVLRPFDIHCGEYRRVVHGYRQRTGPFRVTWSPLTVRDKIAALPTQVFLGNLLELAAFVPLGRTTAVRITISPYE